MKYFMGVDLGQVNDQSAISITEEAMFAKRDPSMTDLALGKAGPAEIDTVYGLVHLEQPPLGTSYPDIVDRVKFLIEQPALMGHTALIVDQTGVGRAVLDLMRREGLDPIGITYTSGQTPSAVSGGFTVPKRDLAMALQFLISTGRYKISPDLELTQKLLEQLEGFVQKISRKGYDSYEALTEKLHDDLVLSIAMPAWYVWKQNPMRIRIGDQQEESYDFDPFGGA